VIRRRPAGPVALPVALVIAIVAVVALLAAGCGRASPGPSDEPVPATDGSPLVSLVRYGGVAGLRHEVTVSPSGQVTVVSDRSPDPTVIMLDARDLARLRTALARSGFATLDADYLDRRAADAFQYDVTYQGRTVTTDEGVVPERLRPVLDQLVGLLA